MTIQIRSARDKYARENESSRNDRVHSHVRGGGGGGRMERKRDLWRV